MLLAIDVGNTNMVFGMFEGETFTGSFRLMTDANRTSDEIGLSAWEYFQRFGLVVLDFGTATTVDAVNREGAYMGGCITAGIRISADALFMRAAMLH